MNFTHCAVKPKQNKTKQKPKPTDTPVYSILSHVSRIIWVKAKVLIVALKALNYLPPSLLCYILDLVFQYSLCSLLSSRTSLFLVLRVILTSGLFTCWLLFLEPSFLHDSPLHSFRFLVKCHLIKEAFPLSKTVPIPFLHPLAAAAAAAAAKSLQSCPTVQPHRGQLTRLPGPWDSLGNNTGVGCHFLLHCMKVKSESEK